MVCYYDTHPAAYFTWAAEKHGYLVFGDKGRKRSINALVRAEAKRRGLDWGQMKAAVMNACSAVVSGHGIAYCKEHHLCGF
jgi:hypothetical protein